MNKAVEVLKMLEWSEVYNCYDGWPCCPICRGIQPGFVKDKSFPKKRIGHHKKCILKNAITYGK